jgi:hypothetical protein
MPYPNASVKESSGNGVSGRKAGRPLKTGSWDGYEGINKV